MGLSAIGSRAGGFKAPTGYRVRSSRGLRALGFRGLGFRAWICRTSDGYEFKA